MNDEFFGLISQPLRLGYFRHAVLISVHQQTLGQALKRQLEFNNIFFRGLTFNLQSQGHVVVLSFNRVQENPVFSYGAIECAMGIVHRLACWLCSEMLAPNNVALDCPPPPHHNEYHYLLYAASVKFNGSANCLTFDAHYLDLPVVQTQTSAETYIRRAPIDIILLKDVQGDTSRAIHKALRLSFRKTQQPEDLQGIAVNMGISTQTLRRRLAIEGSGLNTLKSQVRRDIAMHALDNPELSIEAVAIQTGYSEPAAFI